MFFGSYWGSQALAGSFNVSRGAIISVSQRDPMAIAVSRSEAVIKAVSPAIPKVKVVDGEAISAHIAYGNNPVVVVRSE